MISHSGALRSKFFGLIPDKDVGMSNSVNMAHLRAEGDGNRRNNRPSTGPEIDDLEPGIDDGLLPDSGSRRPSLTPSHPGNNYPNSFDPFPSSVGPGFNAVFPTGPSGVPGSMDVNVYQQKKTLAQGMMDIALLSANANQLRYLLDFRGPNPYFYLSLTLISCSLFFQIAVGVGLILNSRYNIKKEGDREIADRINNFTVIGIFIVTMTNVFVSAFGVTDMGSFAKYAEHYVQTNESDAATS